MLCGRIGFCHRHHIYEGDRRQRSERFGMVVTLCPYCHERAHNETRVNLLLKKAGQRKFERKDGTREQFIKIFGRSYL